MNENDADLLERSEAIASDTSEGAQASVNATAQSCPNTAITVGLFFDGTWNNAYNVSDFRDGEASFDDASYSGSYTNVRRLWDLHFDRAQNVPNACGDADLAYEKRYLEGIGSITEDGDDTYGGVTAGGPAGMAVQVERAAIALREAVNQYGLFEDMREITVNCFGFSRGAAAARVFCNMLADASIPNLKIGFLGIFDTVGSVGIPGNNIQRETPDEIANIYCHTLGLLDPYCIFRPEGQVYDLNITGSTAETVFHIVAGDEFRYFYPSSSALPSHATEVWMAGCHGDIGGAETDELVAERYATRPRFLDRRGWFDEARLELEEPYGRNPASFYYTVKDVRPNIGTASLHAMHFHAQRANVPLHPLDQLSPHLRKPMSTLLGQAASVMEAGVSVPQNLARAIRARYVHKSFGSTFGPDTRFAFTERRVFQNGG